MNNEIIKGYKVRIYPTKEQEEKFNKHIGACRWMWNYFLDLEINNYKKGNKFIDRFELNNLIPGLRKNDKFKWLDKISSASLQMISDDFTKAFKSFFKKMSGFPKFKSKKKTKPSYPIRSERFYFTKDTCQISNIGKVKYKTDLVIPIGIHTGFINARVSYENNKWYVSFSRREFIPSDNRCENQVSEDLSDKSLIGIDLGVKTLATVAYNDQCIIYPNINKSKKMKNLEKRIKHTQRTIARKYRINGNYNKSNNIIREESKLKRLYRKQRNIRKNYIHQVTSNIIKLNPDRVVMENLNVRNLMKNRYMAKSLQEASFGGFIETMEYKCRWNDIEFRQVPRNYPSSKTCSCCGYIKKDLKLSDRIYKCPECGNEIDRDYNAAINLMNYRFE